MNVREISNELQKKAIEELNEVSSRVPTDIETIREWILKQPHLKPRTDDQWLLNFLRCSKFSLERTKEKLDGYYTIKTLLPEYFRNRDPMSEAIQQILRAGIVLPLPRPKDDVGPKIILCRWNWENDVKDMPSMTDIIKVFYMTLDILLVEDDNFTISGAFLWIDFHLTPLSLVLQLTPTVMKKTLTCLQKGYPIRASGLHYTNAPSVFETVFNLTMSVVSPKLRNRMSLHSTKHTENFYKYLPLKYMPKEFGGENGSLPEIKDAWKQKLEACREWFLEDEQYCTNEKLRPCKSLTHADVFGVEGSFRNLTVD